MTTETGCYDVRGRDIRQLYAGFCRITMREDLIWCLSLASSVRPDNHIGFELWITDVAGVTCHDNKIEEWCKSLGRTIATMSPLLGKRRRVLVPSYKPEWGDKAAIDGLQMALLGKKSVKGLRARAEELGCGWEAYKRIRNLVAGSVILQMDQFEEDLKWATRIQKNG
jgi:hypothetical protein